MNTLNASIDYGKELGFLEALEFGGQMVLIGMVAVFAVLGLIWGLLVVFKIVFTKVEKKEEKTEIVQAAATPAPAYAPSENEIIAVIAAAIAMAESESGDGIKFRVVSFRKK